MGTGAKRKPKDPFTVLAHPLRRRVLRAMLSQSGEATPRELATKLGEPLSMLSYHVRVLEEYEAVKQTRTQRVRGATQHFYRPTVKTEWVRTALRTTEDQPPENPGRGEEKG